MTYTITQKKLALDINYTTYEVAELLDISEEEAKFLRVELYNNTVSSLIDDLKKNIRRPEDD